MKKLVLLFSFTLLIANAYSQNPIVLISQQGTINGCSADFFDSGGASGAYGVNENFIITFHSNSLTNDHIKMSFNNFDVDPGDTLIVYDGPNTAATIIGKYNNNNLPPSFVDASIYGNGDLTFKFVSNGTLQNAGWFCSMVCIPLCQDIIAAFDSIECVPHPNDSNYIDICLGSPIRFAALGSGPGVFPQNNAQYIQDSSTSMFIWDFGDGTSDTGRIVYHTYTLLRGYDIALTIIDAHGCMNQNYLNGRVRISTDPIAYVNPVADICSSADTTYMTLGYNINSVVVVEPIMAHQSSSQRYDSTLFLPDGPNCSPGCYNTNVTFTQFLPGQTINSANDILSICVDIEHSWAGDLAFRIICPNLQSVILDSYDGTGANTFLGVPNETDATPYCDPSVNPSGVGGVYCWSQQYPQQGLLNTLDMLGTPIPETDTINHLNYISPENSLSGLIGCPLNGTWNIEICDLWAIDNGYIFWWELNLDPSLLPGGWSYEVPIDTVIWSGSFLHIINDTTVMAVPTTSGSFPYTVTVIDAFGCSYDTTLNIQVVQTPDPDLGPDTTLCGNGLIYTLNASPGSSFNWSTGSTDSIQIVNSTGIYSVEVENYNATNTLTCYGTDTVTIITFNQPLVDLGPNICSASDSTVVLTAGNPGYQYLWNNGTTSQTINVSGSGQYAVTVAETIGNGCEDRDTISVSINPAPALYITASDADGKDIGSDNIEICSHKTINLSVKDGAGYLDNPNYVYTYYWTNDRTAAQEYTRDISLTCLPEGANNWKVYVTGCNVTDTMQLITTRLCSLELPNVFTPNGDLVNDVFEIKNIEDFPNSTLQVFNRWGKKIFESEDYNNSDHAWNGESAAEGVYYYVLTVNYGEKNTCIDAKNFSGSVTIMR
jgi:gliding motility-associated-like protein